MVSAEVDNDDLFNRIKDLADYTKIIAVVDVKTGIWDGARYVRHILKQFESHCSNATVQKHIARKICQNS